MRKIISCLLLSSLILTGCSPEKSNNSALRHFEVKKQTMEESVKATGILRSQKKDVYFSPERSAIVFLVDEGTSVKKGDVIAKLDISELENEMQRQIDEKNLLNQQRRVTKFDNRLKACELERSVGVLKAQQRVAEVTLEQKSKAIDVAEAVRLSREIVNQEKKLDRMAAEILEKEPFVPKGFVSKETIAELKYNWEVGAITRDILKTDLALVHQGTTKDRIIDSQQEVDLARSAANRARIKLERFRKVRAVELRKFKLRIDEHEKEIERLQKTIAKMSYRAPFAGIVTLGRAWQPGGRVTLKQGTRVHPGQEIISVVRPDSLEIKMTLHEGVASRITSGSFVTFRPTSLPDKTFKAEITSVARVASFSEWDMFKTKWVDVTARLEEASPELHLGMSVLADIKLGSRQVLAIPTEAISATSFVTSKSGKKVRVKCGSSSYRLTEIIEGLNLGDIVVASIPPMYPQGAKRKTVQVERKNVVVRVKATGELQPGQVEPVYILATPEQEVKLNNLAEEGTLVQAGSKVAVVDSVTARNTLREKVLAFKVARKEKRLVAQRGKLQLDKLRHAADLAKLDRQLAQLSRDILVTINPLLLKERALQLEIVNKQLEGIKRQLEIKKEMSRRGYASDKEVNRLLERMADVEKQRDVAALRLDLTKQGPTPREKAKSELQVRRTVLAEELAVKKLKLTKEKLAVEEAKAKLAIRKGKREKKRYEDMVKAANITAPTTGVVMMTKRWTGSGMGAYKAGDSVARGAAFMRIARLERFTIKGWLPEEYFADVSPGLPVEFYLPSNLERRYQGKVKKIGLAAVERSVRRGVTRQVFEVEIETQEKSPRFQPGMAVQLEIVTATLKDVPSLPLSCVFVDEEGTYVELTNGNRQPIEVKGFDEERVAISGLAEGKEVLGGISTDNH